MAKIDDYTQAFELGKRELCGEDPELVAQYAGCKMQRSDPKKPKLTLDFFNRPVIASWPDLELMYGDGDDELQIQQKVLLMHYLSGAWGSRGAPLTGEWIAYQEIPDGRFYLDAFLRRAKNPLVQGFGEQPELMEKMASRAFGAKPFDHGDVSVEVRPLPLVRLALILWRGDDEFSPEGNILFDGNISRLFSAEDIAWLAGMTVYPLIGMVKARQE